MADQEIRVNSPIGKARLDSSGAAIGAVRMDPELSYIGIPMLLKEVIDHASDQAWSRIKEKIDYTFTCMSHALDALEAETSFSDEVKARADRGQKLLFKPNLVGPVTIDRHTHGPGMGRTVSTDWPFVAALMRWFRERLDISYNQMMIGEAATSLSGAAAAYTRALGGKRIITPEAFIEGRSGDFYGGWGFYFVRRYLADTLAPDYSDDPMLGYEESVSGTYLPPGLAEDKLMVYDLNRIADEPSKGRDVPVPHGVNFQAITLHKVIVGGEPNDPQDRQNYPGCVLVNLPKLKVHDSALFTNAIKNIGIGLYPMEVNASDKPGEIRWKYAFPHRPSPGIKNVLPHSVWVGEMDEDTLMPQRDEDGKYRVKKTGGMSATMADVIEAVKGQDIFMLHVVDAIEATNGSNGLAGAKLVPEGYVFAAIDPVALDLMCARYLFTTIPMDEARHIRKENNQPTTFFQRVPIPKTEGNNIITEQGFDTSIERYPAFQYCEDRGLGQQDYYVVGRDTWEEGRLATLEGHLGRVDEEAFNELLTKEMYYALSKPLWDLQATSLAYAAANDALTGSSYRLTFLEAFDENGDGIIDYNETGNKGSQNFKLMANGCDMHLPATAIGRSKYLRANFLVTAARLRVTNSEWNPHDHDFSREIDLNTVVGIAMEMSQSPLENQDPMFPEMAWGKGQWPSFQFAHYLFVCHRIYGSTFPRGFDTASLYGLAFRYADTKWGGGEYTGPKARAEGGDLIDRYHEAVVGGMEPLPFTLFVPKSYGRVNGTDIPNVEESQDAAKILTVDFVNGGETWQEFSLSAIL